MLIEAALWPGNLSSHLFFSFVIAKVTVPKVLVPQHRLFESQFSPDTDRPHCILLVPYLHSYMYVPVFLIWIRLDEHCFGSPVSGSAWL